MHQDVRCDQSDEHAQTKHRSALVALKNFFRTPHVTLVVASRITGTTHTLTGTEDLETEAENALFFRRLSLPPFSCAGRSSGQEGCRRNFGELFQPFKK